MPVEIDGKLYYQTSETCKRTGVSRATLFRWLKAGILLQHYRDRRGWRLFAEDDLNTIRAEANKISVEYDLPGENDSRSAASKFNYEERRGPAAKPPRCR